jgi:beta-galactosidase/beta-glucuronidase
MQALLLLMAGLTLPAQDFTRGVGLYPGNPKEDFAPRMRVDGTTYRNLALHRPAYHSSSYDYNLTAELVTDGIVETKLPRWEAVSTSQQGALKKNERQWMFDMNPVTHVLVKGPRAWVRIELLGGEAAPEVDRVVIDARQETLFGSGRSWMCVVSGSDDGQTWNELGRAPNPPKPAEGFAPSLLSVAFGAPSHSRMYRLDFQADSDLTWAVGDVSFFLKDHRLSIGGPYDFTSAWMSAGSGEEWVYVDLGAVCQFDRVVLHWIRPAAEGAIQVSDDAAAWRTLQALPAPGASSDDIKLAAPARGKYVRILMTRPSSPEGYILSELEVYGRGGPVPEPHAAASPRSDGRLDLAGGAWRLQRDSLVAAGGETLSQPGYADQDWFVATVPATVLTSYLNAGALPDPNYGDNQNMISDSFFYADFWYRNEFVAPAASGKHVWLNFDGINWKADVYLNGARLGRIEGGFMRGRFDVTGHVRAGAKNALAVRIVKNATPGSVREKNWQSPDKNGGALGLDNPTYHASVGWDWIPTIRGRNTGIWGDVYLTTTGPVTIENPFVRTALPLPDTSTADVSVEVELRNHDAAPVAGTLRGRFGDVAFETPVRLAASETKVVRLDPSTHPALRLHQPKLWWPAGYGEPSLYPVELKFEAGGHGVSDEKSFLAGVRQFTYSEEGGALRLWINGRRFVARGGNWGFGESMLRYRAREYDTAVRYHREMNLTMIRNWVGQIGDDAFYEACDRHGVVVWQDFWLANPWDGPDPSDNEMFLQNARDFILRIRNHASVGLYCGRNEGFPPKPLDDGLRQMLAELHPGLHYIGSSADLVVSGHGPYQAMPAKFYFDQRATTLLHSELGMPNIVTLDSLRLMMPERAMWPQSDMWGIHDFSLEGAQGGRSFLERIEKSYGGADNAADWVTLAQFVNYEGYRAMFEAQSKHRMGLLIWMSHPAWPSFVWQTYDYYFEPTAAYFGVKKASEPLHIQWNQATDNIEVVNYSAGDVRGLSAQVQLLNMDGSLQWEKTAALDSPEDSMQAPIRMEYPSTLSAVHFLRLRLTRADKLLSENFYWRGTEEGNYRALRTLPKANLELLTTTEREGQRWLITTEVRNVSQSPALMVRLKAVREKSGDRILPAIYSDNYFALMPGEQRTIVTEVEYADTRGEDPRVVVEGFNVGDVKQMLKTTRRAANGAMSFDAR